MYDIDIYNDSAIILERKLPSKIFSWITILIISLIMFFLMSILLEYNKYKSYFGEIYGNLITIYYDSKDIPFKNNDLYIEGIYYNYKLKSISKTPVYIQNNKYYEVIIELEQSLDYDTNLINITFKGEKTTLFKELKRKVSDSYKGIE